MLCCQRLVTYLMQCWTSILHQTISTTRGVRDQPGVIDVWIKLQVSRKPCFHTGPDMNNESTTNETQQHWPHSDRPAVSWALIHAYAFIHFFIIICCQIRSDLMHKKLFSGYITTQSRQKNKQNKYWTVEQSVLSVYRSVKTKSHLYIFSEPEMVLKPKTALIVNT